MTRLEWDQAVRDTIGNRLELRRLETKVGHERIYENKNGVQSLVDSWTYRIWVLYSGSDTVHDFSIEAPTMGAAIKLLDVKVESCCLPSEAEVAA